MSRFDRLYALFADQFEREGAGFLYRKSQKGPPIPVTPAEREAFAAAFRRQLRILMIVMAIGPLALIGGLVASGLNPDGEAEPLWIGGIAGGICITIFVAVFWIWSAPARALARRAAVGAERSGAEMRRIKLASLSYGNLASVAGAGVLYVGSRALSGDVLHGWGRLWLVLGAALVGLAALQAFRKWRMERG